MGSVSPRNWRDQIMIRIIKAFEGEKSDRPEPIFKPGNLVLHRRYGYRAVVVEVTPVCVADEQWYQLNQTQPDRNQPWYYLLVSGSKQTNYAAQSNLLTDPSGLPVEHPLVSLFFSDFKNGSYVRNQRRWPSS